MRITIRLDSTSPQVSSRLLEGLDYWVKIGLLSEAQIEEIALTMSEPLPVPYKLTGTDSSTLAPVIAPDESQSVAAVEQPSRIAQAAAALVEEISVIWLLFLGVFLVVVSSGVLAASQWESFSAVGQYCVLFAYTLAFWGGERVGAKAGKSTQHGANAGAGDDAADSGELLDDGSLWCAQ